MGDVSRERMPLGIGDEKGTKTHQDTPRWAYPFWCLQAKRWGGLTGSDGILVFTLIFIAFCHWFSGRLARGQFMKRKSRRSKSGTTACVQIGFSS